MKRAIIIIGIAIGLIAHLKSRAQSSYRWGQVSIIPGLSTGHGPADQKINHTSFNLFGGHEYGFKGAELGLLFNLNTQDIKGAQVSGLYNQTGGQTVGAQFAGLSNVNFDQVKGAQVAGINNHVKGDIRGAQVSGLTNSITGKATGAQVAGLGNWADVNKGIQLSGLANISRLNNGAQVSGMTNLAKETHGVQVSTVYNQSQVLKGWQIGLVNVADSIESGGQFGLVNIVRKNGLMEFGIEYSDVIPTRISFRSGIDQFYSILSVGSQWQEDDGQRLWSFGVGFGSKVYQKKNFYTAIELVAHEIREYDEDLETLNLLNKLHVNFGYQIFDHLSITAGPVLNFYIAQLEEDGEQSFQDVAKNPFYDEVENGYALQGWVGYSLSIKF